MTPVDQLESGGVNRIFRSRNKINLPGTISHITQRASGTERLFHEDDDYLEMLARLKRLCQTHEIEFISFVLMPNHVHLLLRQTEANLYEAMRELFSRYAQRYNKKYERKGHLFGSSYRQAVCLDEAYVLAVSLYIHLNPVRARLVLQPSDYRWSSCRLFTESGTVESFVSPQRVLELLSHDSLEARDSYRRMLEEGRKLKIGEIIEDRLAIHDLQWKFSSLFHLFEKLTRLHKRDRPEHWDETEVEQRIARFMEGGVEIRPMPQSEEARKHLVEQLVSRGFTRKEIAQRLGVSRKTIYNLLQRPSSH